MKANIMLSVQVKQYWL